MAYVEDIVLRLLGYVRTSAQCYLFAGRLPDYYLTGSCILEIRAAGTSHLLDDTQGACTLTTSLQGGVNDMADLSGRTDLQVNLKGSA